MTVAQVVVFIVLLSWIVLSIRGALSIIGHTFLPTTGEIVEAFVISFILNGLLVGFLCGLAFVVTLVV